MQLRTKLLLGVGLLLFAMAIIMYILPTILIRKDVYKAADEIKKLLLHEHRQLVKSQQLWLEEALGAIKENNNALLFMLDQEPRFSAQFAFGPKNSDATVWHRLARLLGYDPSIAFVQAHSPDEKKTAVIDLNASHLYPIHQFSKQDGLAVLSLLDEDNKQQSFIGVILPKEMQREGGYTLYALLNPKRRQEQMAEVNEEIIGLTPDLVEKKLSGTNQLFTPEENKNHSAFMWGVKVNMIRSLTTLFSEGPSSGQSINQMIPEGLARLDETGKGYVILTHEVFSTEPLFNDVDYYEHHQPLFPSSSQLANGSLIVRVKGSNRVYICNTLLLDTTYVSIGSSLDILAQQLALSSNKTILLNVQNNYWVGYDGEGQRLSPEIMNQIVSANISEQKQGQISINEGTFVFSRAASLENGTLNFFDLYPLEEKHSIVSTLLSLEDKLSKRISMQLFLVSLGTMVLILLFIGRILVSIIYPVTKLARATQDVVKGRYGEVVLPDVGDRKDEIATLTRAFADMVSGLQDREKIRGVLDKVVSKEVADEILRTHIHLGGEDRVVTMLFADIRGFSTVTANLPPQKIIQILNECMTKVSQVIEGEGGVIDKYVGDEVMAIYGAPTSHSDHALRAVSSAMLIVETLKVWNQSRVAANEEVIEMGIGVHTGVVVAGNMGAENRLNYTVLGTHVNLAARLCEVAKPNQLIISETTLSEPNIKESFYVKPLPPIALKGFAELIAIYEITGFKWEE